MNAVKAPVLAASAIIVLGGCITTHRLSVSVENKAAPDYQNGMHWLKSVKRNTVAVSLLTPIYKTDTGDQLPPAFLVEVSNGGDQTIELSRDDITATVDGRPIQLLTYGEYCRLIYRESGWAVARIQRALHGAAPSDRGIDSPSQNLSDTGPRGYVEVMGAPNVDSSSEVLGATEISTINLHRDADLANARMMLTLDQSSLAPGVSITGVFRLKPSDLPGRQRLRIMIKAGDEMHEFLYDVRS
jgi:hypothetical protein